MNILFLTSGLNISGGIARHDRVMLRAVKSIDGVSLRVLSLNDALADSGFGLSDNRAGRSFNDRKAAFFLSALAAVRAADVLVVGHVNYGMIALLAKLIKPAIKVMIVCHGIDVWRPLGKFKTAALRRADSVIAVSQYTRNEIIKRHGVAADRVRVIFNCVDPDIPAPDGAVRADRDGGFEVLCVGRLDRTEREKGYETIIDAVSELKNRLPGLRCYFVGDGAWQVELAAKAEAAGVSGSVIFTGRLDEAELAARYGSCDVFVLPSRKEGFGLVYIEAFLFGKPCIGARETAVPEVIADGVDGCLIDYGDVGQLAEQLFRLAQEPEKAREMGRRGLQKTRGIFSYERFRTETEDSLRGLMDIAR